MLKYAYISKHVFPDGELSISAKAADGSLLFGFRTRDAFGWRERARSYTPSTYIPVFDGKPPMKLLA